jgi:hypothetical protein
MAMWRVNLELLLERLNSQQEKEGSKECIPSASRI